ncbi:MAG: hypothetical protein KKA81_15045 [Bacteroidetes bacterium]|nr:hypothetical protein [Bacteroidota bacterium]
MKYSTLLAGILIGISATGFSQEPLIMLTFTADSNQYHVDIDSLYIKNLSKDCDTILYAPDTILLLDYITKLQDHNTTGQDVVFISQNYPNPIKGKTIIRLSLRNTESIIITVFDILGRSLIHQKFHLCKGNHHFIFYPGMDNIYFLNAMTAYESHTIKMFNIPSKLYMHGICKLEYNGFQTGTEEYRKITPLNNFTFVLGDHLKYTAYTILGERSITSSPSNDETYSFHFTGESCTGTSTVSDIDGNIYNTVQLGSQCWMKENLKTTTYRNGTPIPNVTDDYTWNNLTSGAYVWYNNDIFWKDKYGALYNWYATVDTNALCPTGWHVPTKTEWTDMINYIGGNFSPHGNEIKSCRQINSPLGGMCNVSGHPRWIEDIYSGNYGTDKFGFSALPGGLRGEEAAFYDFGRHGLWWSSSESIPESDAWLIYLDYYAGYIIMEDYVKVSGFSVRCIKD